MEYDEYKPIRDERKAINKKIRAGDKSQRLVDRLTFIEEKLKNNPPSLVALYGCIGED